MEDSNSSDDSLLDDSESEEEPTKYGDKAYWDERLFEWKDVKECLEKSMRVGGYFVPSEVRILAVGAGNAPFHADMYDDGYTNQVCTDTSPVVVEQMRKLHVGRPGMRYVVGDVTDMREYGDASFDVIVEKGLYDTIVCEDRGRELTQVMFAELHRVLRPDGLLFCLSLHVQFDIMSVLGMGCFGWALAHARLPNPSYEEAKENSERHTLAVAQKPRAGQGQGGRRAAVAGGREEGAEESEEGEMEEEHDADLVRLAGGGDDDYDGAYLGDARETEQAFIQSVLDRHDTRSVRATKAELAQLRREQCVRVLDAVAKARRRKYVSRARATALKDALCAHRDPLRVGRALHRDVTRGAARVDPERWRRVINSDGLDGGGGDDDDDDDEDNIDNIATPDEDEDEDGDED